MAGETALTDVNGVQKRVYDKSGLTDYLPEVSILQRDIGFDGGTQKVGESYQFGVVLQLPNGFTYAGSSGAVATLKQGRPMKIQQASVTPFELELREQYSFALLSRAKEQGEGAFAAITGEILKAMKKSASIRLESQMLLGQYGLGTLESVADLGGNSGELVITAATWAPGLWWAVGAGATLDSFTSTTKNNGTGALIITKIDAQNRKLTVTYSGTLSSEAAAGDVLYWEGAWDGTTHAEASGFLTQASNTTGTSLGISAATYTQWQGNTSAIGGNISADIIEGLASDLRDRGAMSRLKVYLSNKAYSVAMAELRTQRVFDSSYSSAAAKSGVRAISYETPEIGTLELVNHPFMPQGLLMMLDTTDCARAGSADLQFGVPGSDIDAPVWERVTGSTAAEVLLFSDQASLLKVPAHALVGTGVTYT